MTFTLAALSTLNTPAQNTAAIVAAFPDVELPDGSFDVDPVPLVSGMRMRGGGKRRTTLRLADRTIHNDLAFGGALNLHGASGAPITDVVLEDLTVDGNAAGLTLTGTTEPLNIEAISMSFAERCHFYRVRAINACSDGFDYDDSSDCTSEDCELEACGGFGIHNSLRSRNNVHMRAKATACGFVRLRGGFDAHGTPPNEAHHVTYIACRSVACYRGFLLGADYAILVACRDDGSEQNGLRITGDDASVVACKFLDTIIGNAITIDAGDRNMLVANTCHGAAGGGIVLPTGAASNVVVGNGCHTNSGRGIQINVGASGNATVANACTGNTAGNTLNSGSGGSFSLNV